jgi:hypothetical protein
MTTLIPLSERLLMDGYTYSYGFAAVDLTGNGVPDLISADTNVGLYWLENDGHGNFTRHIIHERTGEWLERNAIADINGDGRPEVVIVDNIGGSVLYFAYTGDPRERANWTHHYILQGELPGAYDVAVADFDGDGDLDVAASSWRKSNRFDWFEQRDGAWIRHPIETEIGETRTVCAADFDGDGKMDLLGTARTGNQVIWYQNPGDPTTQPWRKTVIDHAVQPCHGHPVDMDGDGDLDVVMALGMSPPHDPCDPEHQMIVWYENNGNPTEGPWQRHTICAHFPNAFEAIAVDLDGDGQMEVVATAWDLPGRVALFKHSGDPRGPWQMQMLKEGWPRANQVIAVDIDGDGWLDIVASAERGSNELRWWRNLSGGVTP